MALAHLTLKGTRAAEALYPSGDILYSNRDSVASGDNEKEDDGKSKREKAIAATTVRPLESPLRYKDEDYEEEEGEGSPGEKEYEVRDNDHKDDVLDNVEEQEQDVSSAHKGDYYLSEQSETSNNFEEEDVEELKYEDNDEEDDGTGVKDFDGDSDGDKNTNAGGGPVQWLQLLIPKAITEAVGVMAQSKAHS